MTLALRIRNRAREAGLAARLWGIRSRPDFEAYLRRHPSELFAAYRRASESKRREFSSFVGEAGITLAGRRCLDIGPGYGDAIDVCLEAGAAGVAFVERELLFYTHNRLKPGTRGHRFDLQMDLARLRRDRAFDLVWAKGAVVADHFIDGRHTVPWDAWLATLDEICRPGAVVMLCPDWHRDAHGKPRRDPLDNPFTASLLRRGYVARDDIDSHVRAGYPVTFVRYG